MHLDLKAGYNSFLQLIKEFMSYLKSAGVSKVDKSLWTYFIAGEKKGKLKRVQSLCCNYEAQGFS